MLSRYWKAIIAFVTPLLALIVAISTDPDIAAALPGVTGWLVTVGIPVLTSALTFLVRNKQTAEDLDSAADRLGLKLVPKTTPTLP